ncbi:MAG: methyltransferase domain-containing protein [Dehalococcoidia bacterium]|nr:methyltransferase domain-containing protein [Dehalococcoidia bacterium]MCA9856465.1 methyltransferase domain-containing protein [Dehalococcoidia bacterium]MCB9482778.1 methyltransferase domain-containing protein [Dehalococcoidia bacterium]
MSSPASGRPSGSPTTAQPAQAHPNAGQPDAARLGNPSFVWRSGQERRVALMERYVSFEGRRVLDLGCGLGEYVRAFARRGADAVGSDVAMNRLAEARERVASSGTTGVRGFFGAAGEFLPLHDSSMDVIVLNEVIEHVQDDRATMLEIARVLKPGGTCILYAPNRLYPFETHGIYLGKRYVFGNIPFVNWLPTFLRDRLVPHARAYRHGDWKRLIRGTDLRIVDHTYVYPGFDNIHHRSALLAKVVRGFCYWAEGNPLRRFGLSHLVVLQRDAASTTASDPATATATTTGGHRA